MIVENQIVAKWGSVRTFQKVTGLDPDGVCGSKTERNWHLTEAGRAPIPEGRDRVTSVYGQFTYNKVPDSRNIKLTGRWEAENIVRVQLHTGKVVRVHKAMADEFRELFQAACEAAGKAPQSVQTFVPRFTNGLKNLSMHSWGIAVDFDPKKNPYGGRNSWLRTEAGQKFVAVFEAAGWTWGGRWSFRDDMHFQRCYQ